MDVVTFEGVVEDGKIRLPANARLPEKAKVYVVIPNPATPPLAYVANPRLADRNKAKDFEKAIIG